MSRALDRAAAVADLIVEVASVAPEAEAVVAGDRRLSFAKFVREALGLAARLKASGLERGERVGLYAANSAEYLVIALGTWMAGGVLATVYPEFGRSEHAPIGFISFDLDYYSSTKAALAIFATPAVAVLPRVICYFDDVTSDGHQLHCDNIGELLAIREFNEQNVGSQTLAAIGALSADLLFPAMWMQQLWVYHRFQHPDYNRYIGGRTDLLTARPP